MDAGQWKMRLRLLPTLLLTLSTILLATSPGSRAQQAFLSKYMLRSKLQRTDMSIFRQVNWIKRETFIHHSAPNIRELKRVNCVGGHEDDIWRAEEEDSSSNGGKRGEHKVNLSNWGILEIFVGLSNKPLQYPRITRLDWNPWVISRVHSKVLSCVLSCVTLWCHYLVPLC